ncbi:MAG: hypothetical protein J5I98_33380 [Phaeodactylibacter sp.]|nr:hypothetical protein [Phaeodactylibacter sp.]
MRNLFFATLALFLFSSSALFGQQQIDVVYLKNGSVVKGAVIENKMNEHVKLRTADGSVFLYRYDEIDKLAVEEQEKVTSGAIRPSEMQDKTGQVGLGVLLSSAGSGAAVHYNLNPTTALEINALSKGMVLNCGECFDETQIVSAFMLAGSVNHFLNEFYKQHKEKTKRNGVSVKAGHSFGNNKESFLAVSWIQENIKDRSPKHSFFFELGGGVIKLHGFDDSWTYPNGNTVNFMLNIKVHWNWYVN